MTRLRGSGVAGALAFAAWVVSGGDAHAVVVQVNGLIVPDTADGIQNALNRGENGCPNPADLVNCFANQATPPNNNGNPGPQGAIDAVMEARIEPEVFSIPQPGGVFGSIRTTFLWHGGAYYRNTFGWYNAGDDLSNFANLHPIITPYPIPAGYYYQAGEGTPFQNTIDFQAEFTAGRYKGGFVGFYLITPEGSANGDNGPCHGNGQYLGYYNYQTSSTACVGRIYYTERQLNGDGNYVHYLIYQTKVLDPNKSRRNNFYFSFEDTYRSNDVGTADDTIFVEGLVVPCVPSPEICDGKDNNCDGIVDNNPVDAGGACSQIPGNPVGIGECKAGVLQCIAASPGDLTTDTLVCLGEVGPKPEACNGKDDDCNGKVDDAAGNGFVPPLPNVCGATSGQCQAATLCVAGKPTCVEQVGPQPETCNGLDDNCNGVVDDNPAGVGLPCTPNPGDPIVGECKSGTTACVPQQGNNPASDKLVCQGYVGPQPEICDGKDNNCDGLVDNNPTDLAPTCIPSGTTVCQPGYEICVSGAKVCVGFTFPAPETCNGKDDNCDGVIDNGPIDVGEPCGSSIGQCQPGTIDCVASTPGDPGTDMLVCVGGVGPSPELCDGIDNNCNGQVDENPGSLPGVGVDCSTACGPGVTICKNGLLQCHGISGGTVEVCNGKDDDCNGVIDDNPIDVGGLCGDVVLDPNIKQNPDCKMGQFACVPAVPGDLTTDHLVCEGENAGSPEICNGVDDNCNGIVDENVPGEGADCAPEGTTLPLQGECKPGKLYCIDGKMQCEGGIGPQPEVCDGKDHNCDGKIDTPACPGQQKCIGGECRSPCHGEFGCPGGQSCVDGYCVTNNCKSQCLAGTICDQATGECVPSGDGGVDGSAGAAGSAHADSGASGHGGGGAGGGADAGAAADAGSKQAPDTNNDFGLTTGGGGVSCAVAGVPRAPAPSEVLLVSTAALLALKARRRRRLPASRDVSVKEVV